LAIYVDSRSWNWRGELWGHLIADSTEELHLFAARLGLQHDWYQGGAKYPHYDLTLTIRANAIAFGAIQLNGRAFIDKARLAVGNREPEQLVLLF
jgi:hypothetical protein